MPTSSSKSEMAVTVIVSIINQFRIGRHVLDCVEPMSPLSE
jgi:hypothetical protein